MLKISNIRKVSNFESGVPIVQNHIERTKPLTIVPGLATLDSLTGSWQLGITVMITRMASASRFFFALNSTLGLP